MTNELNDLNNNNLAHRTARRPATDRLGAPGTPTLRLPTEEKTHLNNNNLNEHQLRQEVRHLPPHHVNSRRARHAAPSCGLLRLQLRPTTTTTHALRPALSPPPPPLRLTDPPWAWFELSDGRGRRARGTLLPPRTVYPDRNSLPACARGARQATASSDGTAVGRQRGSARPGNPGGRIYN